MHYDARLGTETEGALQIFRGTGSPERVAAELRRFFSVTAGSSS